MDPELEAYKSEMNAKFTTVQDELTATEIEFEKLCSELAVKLEPKSRIKFVEFRGEFDDENLENELRLELAEITKEFRTKYPPLVEQPSRHIVMSLESIRRMRWFDEHPNATNIDWLNSEINKYKSLLRANTIDEV